MKKRIKTGDEIIVIAGNHKGERGKVLQVFPSQERVLVEGINLKTRHQKANTADGQSNPEGGIIKREAPFHLSNVMQAERWDSRQGAKQVKSK